MRLPVAGRYETVIVGAGIAGLACARRLHDSERSFLLITKNVGGRVRTSVDGTVNLGAYYVRDDYSHVNQFVDRGRRMKRRQILRGDPSGSFSRWDVPLILHPLSRSIVGVPPTEYDRGKKAVLKAFAWFGH